jgi:hypothetical protein
MRSAAIRLVVLGGGILLTFGDARRASGENYKLDYPKEAFGFSGTLSAEVARAPDKVYGWFEIKVVKVVGFARNNRTSVRSPKALTEVWKDKYVAVLGVKGMPDLQVGDMVTVVVVNREVHLRASEVSKAKPADAEPDGAAPTAKKAEATVDPRAEAYLNYARKLIDQGMADKAKARLKEIVEKFPGSKPAEEASKLLEELEKEAAKGKQ